jgi:hypothetical protein
MRAEVEMGGSGNIEWPRDYRGHVGIGNPRRVIGRPIDSQQRPQKLLEGKYLPRSAQEVQR